MRILILFLILALSCNIQAQEIDSTVSRIIQQGFTFERSIVKVRLPETCEVKPPGYVPKYSFQSRYTVLRESDQKIVLDVTGMEYLEEKDVRRIVPDVRDIDFDGNVEFIVPILNEPKIDHFYSFDVKADYFTRLPISEVWNLEFDEKSKQARGYVIYKNVVTMEPETRIDYVFEGVGLPKVGQVVTPLKQ